MAKLKFVNLHISQHKVLLWIIAVLITLSSAVYQRMTGPTYPVRGSVSVNETDISFKLLRSETTDKDADISFEAADQKITGYVRYKRYKSNDDWTNLPLKREGSTLQASLPRQPAAGKLIYYVFLQNGGQEYSLTGPEPVIIRFKGSVPALVLIPHVLFMFIGMLFSNRAGIESLDRRGNAARYMYWTIGLFFISGLILGPVVQKFAFDAYWTGIPFGHDLTDNKTLIAAIGWLVAWIKNRKGRDGRIWIFFAAILMLAVYLIPHSVMGSELDYTEIEGN